MASSSDALTATDALMQRSTRSAVLVARKAASAATGTFGSATTGRIMLRWFSTVTLPPCRAITSAGISAQIRRRCCSLAVVRCTSTHGRVTRFGSRSPRGSNHGAWFLFVAFRTNRPSCVTASAHTTGTRPGAGAWCRRALWRFHTSGPVAATVLLPFFFMSTGLRALIEPDSAAFLAVFVAATAATMAGKVAGAALPARATGERWSFALAIGALMQAKGLMEVVVLAVLLDAGLIGPTVFSALVAMAIACTVAAAPLARIALARGRDAVALPEGTAAAAAGSPPAG